MGGLVVGVGDGSTSGGCSLPCVEVGGPDLGVAGAEPARFGIQAAGLGGGQRCRRGGSRRTTRCRRCSTRDRTRGRAGASSTAAPTRRPRRPGRPLPPHGRSCPYPRGPRPGPGRTVHSRCSPGPARARPGWGLPPPPAGPRWRACRGPVGVAVPASLCSPPYHSRIRLWYGGWAIL